LILSGNTLYGTTDRGGDAGNGTVFSINTDGTGFTSLYNFSGGDDGAEPNTLTLSSNILYGTTYSGGSGAAGTVFAINTDGTGFTTLYSFTTFSGSGLQRTNRDGGTPNAGLVLSGNTLYGTTQSGGMGGNGTVFSLNTDGTGFTTLYSFTALSAPSPHGTNSDGAYPEGDLVLSGNTLYGTADSGGGGGGGTVFKVNTDGTGFKSLYSFTATKDGAFPDAGLFLSGNTLYGTTSEGGASGNGTVFKLNADGTGFTSLHNFTATSTMRPFMNSDGAIPFAGLIMVGNRLYGTTGRGGTGGSGTIFSISLPANGPQLTIASAGQNVVLSWPTNTTGFTLESATNSTSPLWTTNLPAPVVVNGQNTVTNPISGTQQFYRLSQ
jgi:uncharacterized repeat protein (TIGR03803 family)